MAIRPSLLMMIMTDIIKVICMMPAIQLKTFFLYFYGFGSLLCAQLSSELLVNNVLKANNITSLMDLWLCGFFDED